MKNSINNAKVPCRQCREQTCISRDAVPATYKAVPLLEVHGDEVFVDSAVVARKFDMSHTEFELVVWSTLADLQYLVARPKCPHPVGTGRNGERYWVVERKFRGRPYTAILMNRQLFTAVASQCTSRGVLEWQARFVDGFHHLERQLNFQHRSRENIEWQELRALGIKIRRLLEDVIWMFANYARAQGSRHSEQYFKHVTNVIYRSLGFITAKGLKVRDGLTPLELMMLTTAELYAKQRLAQLMHAKVPYKDIFAQLAGDIFQFCRSLPQPDSEYGVSPRVGVGAHADTMDQH